jgi:hypothetical protein
MVSTILATARMVLRAPEMSSGPRKALVDPLAGLDLAELALPVDPTHP